MSRLTLPNGDWVDLADRINHAQYTRYRKADAAGLDRIDEGICAMVTDWALRDVDDRPIPFPKDAGHAGIPAAALERVPIDTFLLMAERAAELLLANLKVDDEGLVPKDTGETSPDSAREAVSPLTPTSPMPTSSSTSRAGRGRISSPPLPM